ncbi:orotidine-5'-phosphate decarboxylase [Egibacter rhizosphaerae]|uniref:orotidine-5'-phosphate decarboxylase n=1 Tax=Egibacter rhizosphaerae TaxID=1670831 RepID=UPI0013F173C2|nr:orotidine-5'-phosphate decarboxylase [Egibacter rhizosphaerae]
MSGAAAGDAGDRGEDRVAGDAGDLRDRAAGGNPLVAALDTATRDRLAVLAAELGPEVGYLKVGLEAFTAHGGDAVQIARAHAPVFLDAKLHDIPATVEGAAAAASTLGVSLLTVHAGGGPAMIAAAARGAPDVRILAVTVLTSLDDDALAAMGQPPAVEQVPRLARMAVEAGAAGLVCAPGEVAAVRAAVGARPLVVTPGIRPAVPSAAVPSAAVPSAAESSAGESSAGESSAGELSAGELSAGESVGGTDDQARVGTPAGAIAAGADLLVVGRPLTRDPDPAAAARRVRRECAEAGR